GEEIYIKNNNLAEVPSGTHVFGGVPFNVKGIIQLGCSTNFSYIRPLPEDVTDIPVPRKFSKLHLLHNALYLQGPKFTEPVAKLVLHYADGQQVELPIVPWKQMMPFEGPVVPQRLAELPRDSELAWIGSNPYLKD